MEKKIKNNDTTKFVIFGQGRSGSNLLVDLLNSHPDIHCDRELLNKTHLARKKLPLRTYAKLLPYRYINSLRNKHKNKIYGFKLMYHQLAGNQTIKPKLFNDNWKIIHIQRNNILQQTLSGLIAKKTRKYMRTIKNQENNEVIYIDPQKVLDSLKIRSNALKYECNVLESKNYLNVIYENDLLNHELWNKKMIRIFNYLGVNPVKVTTSTLKTNSRTNEERISNYSEILEHLKNNGFNDIVEQHG